MISLYRFSDDKVKLKQLSVIEILLNKLVCFKKKLLVLYLSNKVFIDKKVLFSENDFLILMWILIA